MTEVISLDASQLAVAEAQTSDRQYVIAGAGQGKTQVLVSRLQYLVDEEGLNPADEILVLSFSRAAVEAARKRASRSDLDQVTVRTFDSLASLILLELGDVDERHDSFEARIRQATALLEQKGLPDSLLAVTHLCIDEAQDLVGDRAKLAEAFIVAAGDGLGVTVLGDPLQGIYDFQLTESHDKTTARKFMERLVKEHGAELRQLDKHYRAKSERALELITVGNAIRQELELGPATQGSFEQLERFRTKRPTCDPFELLSGLLHPEPETTAILCATNYEVLRASEVLAELGVDHTVRRQAQELGAAPWVWEALGSLEPTGHHREDVLDRLRQAGRHGLEEDWLALKQSEGNSRDYKTLDLARLGRRIMSRSIPVALTVNDICPVTISTVHRAKGLEFDHVIYIETDDNLKDLPNYDELTRRTYVALSRARDCIDSGRISKSKALYRKKHEKTGRWTEMRFGKPQAYVGRMEILSMDVASASPYAPDLNGPAFQSNIFATPLGSEITAVKIVSGVDGQPSRYEFRNAEGVPLGLSSVTFGYDVKKVYQKGRLFNWPQRFTGLRLASVECAAGSPDQTEEVGLGRSGLWLVPRFTGLARAHWKDTE